ncbi:MAG: mechanosensitive ion channel [Bacteroidaceae bacterium]|nr:mechanosensitive ion channel [Bacteroidaceae bacterium]
MMHLLEATPLEAGKSVIEAAKNGEVDQLIHQAISMGMEAGKSLLLAIVIFIVGRYAIKFINKFVARMLERRNVEPTVQSFLKSFVNITLIILLVIMVVGTLGVNTTSLAALLASAGLAVGMALSGNLQNLAGGIILLFLKPFKVGDFIEAQGVSGVVKAIQIFHTILTTTDNKELFVPNGALSSGNITNFSKNELRRVDFTISVEYGSEVDKVKRVTLELVQQDKRIVADPAPFIAVKELADSSVDFVLRVWTTAPEYWNVFFDMNERIYTEFNKQGIGFPFPQLQIHQTHPQTPPSMEGSSYQ